MKKLKTEPAENCQPSLKSSFDKSAACSQAPAWEHINSFSFKYFNFGGRQILRIILFLVVMLTAVGVKAQPSGPEVIWKSSGFYNSNDAIFTKDDKFIVTTNEKDILVLDASDGKVLRKSSYSSIRRQIRISEDDSVIYHSGDDSCIYKIKFSDLTPLKTFVKIDTAFKRTNKLWRATIQYFDLSPDGQEIIFSCCGRAFGVYNLASDSIECFEQVSTSSDANPYHKVQFFDNDRKFIIAYDRELRIYDTETKNQINKINCDQDFKTWIADFALSPDESKVATIGTNSDSLTIIWDLQTKKKLVQFTYSTYTNFIRFFDNNTLWCGFSKPMLLIWDIRTPKILRKEMFGAFFVWSFKKYFTLIRAFQSYYLLDNQVFLTVNDSLTRSSEKSIILNNGKLKISDPTILLYYSNYKVFNNIGELVDTGVIEVTDSISVYEIDFSKLLKGIYFITFFNQEKHRTLKFIKGE